MHHKVIIIGGGPAGYTAALYASRAALSPLCVEGIEAGGQLMQTSEIENYPGARDNLGPDLMMRMREQAEEFGTEFVTDNVTKVNLSDKLKRVWIGDEIYTADAVIISTGAQARMLGLSREKELLGRGVSTCATCDGYFFRDKEIAVVGGGDSAMEEAIFLTKFASKVHLIHRSDQYRASNIMLERARKNPKIVWHPWSVITALQGEIDLHGIDLQSTQTGDAEHLACEGLFIAIGHIPNTDIFKDQLECDSDGYIISSNTKTSLDGVFAAGDVQDKRYRQAITSAGSGCMAALEVEHYLADQN
jgi:thioredoxin reductase (NADPH)